MITTYATFDGKEFSTDFDEYAKSNAFDYERKKLKELSDIARKEIEDDFDRDELTYCLGGIPNKVICTLDNYLYLSAFEEFHPSENSTIELGMWDDIKDEPFSYIVFNKLQDALDEVIE